MLYRRYGRTNVELNEVIPLSANSFPIVIVHFNCLPAKLVYYGVQPQRYGD